MLGDSAQPQCSLFTAGSRPPLPCPATLPSPTVSMAANAQQMHCIQHSAQPPFSPFPAPTQCHCHWNRKSAGQATLGAGLSEVSIFDWNGGVDLVRWMRSDIRHDCHICQPSYDIFYKPSILQFSSPYFPLYFHPLWTVVRCVGFVVCRVSRMHRFDGAIRSLRMPCKMRF